MQHFQPRTDDSPNDHHAYPSSKDLTPRSPYLPSPVLKFDNSPRPSSIASSTLDDILLPGDYVSEGGMLQGDVIRRVSLGSSPRASLDDNGAVQPATEFEVVRRLGTGSYAVVYLVREVLSRPPASSGSDDSAMLGHMDFDDSPYSSRRSSIAYGREYAIKCLSKANLDQDQLSAQMIEVKIHQSLNSHANIVTLHRTLETPQYLLLLLEFVPGEDLFYFLEQARDHDDSPSSSGDESMSSMASNTPPTPSLLSALHPSHLLTRTRLRLVASMFAQMCEAVAVSHAQGVYHRDIKPENFIVTDGFVQHSDGSRERKVLVKLTDFGLSTVDKESFDMDCGSAPYMSYECRNNVAPSYRTDAADVWSLGIVLINMLYHHNPWTDTRQGTCPSFSLYRSNPVQFIMGRFGGMTRTVAEYLATNVFSILEDGEGPTGAVRVSAHDLGVWVQTLPDMLAPVPAPVEAFNKRHQRVMSTASSIDHPVSSTSQVSHRPCSRNPSGSTPVTRTPAVRSRSLSRAPSGVGIVYDRPDMSELSTVIDQDVEESQEYLPLHQGALFQDDEAQDIEVPSPEYSPSPSRSASTNRRRKRGRKGKGAPSSTPTTPRDETLDMLAKASQSLAREISKQSKTSSIMSGTSSGRPRRKGPTEPPCLFPVPMAMLSSNPMAPPPLPALATSLSRPEPTKSPVSATKKPSKWKLSIGKSKGAAVVPPPTEDPPSPLTPPAGFAIRGPEPQMSVTASNVSSLLMGLNAPPAPPAKSTISEEAWPRGRRGRRSPGPARGPPSRSPASSHSRARAYHTGFGATDEPVPALPSNAQGMFSSPNHSSENWAAFETSRGRSPNSYRSGPPTSGTGSMASSNWRSSMSTTSSALTSTSAFTSYSNTSSRSVSTAATSVSGHSWRNKDKTNPSVHSGNSSRFHQAYPNVPRNVKIMSGVPEELVTLPRGLANEAGSRKQRTRKPKDLALDSTLGTINERPAFLGAASGSSGQKSSSSAEHEGGSSPGDGKAKTGQINALGKLLSAMRNR